MKLKNIFLAIKDQLPLVRLMRNLRKGHLLGLFSKRSHFTESGKEKISYPRKDSATKAAASMTKKHGVWFSNYKCIWCDGYHIGKNRDNKPKIP